MTNLKISLNSKGFSLAEVVISFGIISAFAAIVITGSEYMSKQATSVRVDNQGGEVIAAIANRIIANTSSYQVDFSTSNAQQAVSDGGLPVAWDLEGNIGNIGECHKCEKPINKDGTVCDKCDGRYGIVVKPLTGFKGLYMVTLVLEHPTFLEDDNKERRKYFQRLVGN